MKQSITLYDIKKLTPNQLEVYKKRWIPRPGDVIYLVSLDKIGMIFRDIEDRSGRHLSVYWQELGSASTILLSDDIICIPSVGVMGDMLLRDQQRGSEREENLEFKSTLNLVATENFAQDLWELVKLSLN